MSRVKETERAATVAWDALLEGVQAAGWRVWRRRGREAIYRTPGGRVGTLTLKEYDDGAWRWTVDRASIRWPGKMTLATPVQPADRDNCDNEFTCDVAELAVVGAWLVPWLVAYDAGTRFPDTPVPLSRGEVTWECDYCWTALGERNQSVRDQARRATRRR